VYSNHVLKEVQLYVHLQVHREIHIQDHQVLEEVLQVIAKVARVTAGVIVLRQEHRQKVIMLHQEGLQILLVEVIIQEVLHVVLVMGVVEKDNYSKY